ncbi:MAG: tetratricopeptide repeat protein [Phycisphaerales bacterium]|nr:tetratricopeptide repeat protein [Phycisphaerales bacterium]
MTGTPVSSAHGAPLDRLLSAPWLAAIVGALVYLNATGNLFTYDDVAIVQQNPAIRSPLNFRQIWLTDWWGPYAAKEADLDNPRRDRLYRPLSLFSFSLNYALHGESPRGYHIANLALHSLACYLVWVLIFRLLADRSVAAATALLFAVHPVHCEAVAGIVGRAEVLAALFLLGGCIALLPANRIVGGGRTAIAAGMFLLALLSKETAICYLALALIVLHSGQPAGAAAPLRWWAPRVAILLMPLFVYLPLRIYALQGNLIRDRAVPVVMNPVAWATGVDRILAPFTIIGHYTRQLLMPDRLISDYGVDVINPDHGPNGYTVVGLAVTAAMGAALAGYARSRGTWRNFAVLAAASIASYALISNTVLLIGVAAAERLMYWPSAPLLAMAALAALTIWRRFCQPGQALERVAGLLRVAALLMLAALAIRAGVRNADWYDNLMLFQRDAIAAPENHILNRSAARTLLVKAHHTPLDSERRRLLVQAEKYALRAKQIAPREADNLDVLARIYLATGDRDKALEYARIAADLNPNHRPTRILLDELTAATAKASTERIAALHDHLSANPGDVAARVELAQLLLSTGQNREALKAAQQAAEQAPDNPAALSIYAELLVLSESEEKAVQVYRRVIELTPNDWRAHANLAHMLSGPDPQAALRHAQRAMELNPTDVRTHINYAESLAINNRVEEAIRHFRRIYEGLAADDPLRPVAAGRIRDLSAIGK